MQNYGCTIFLKHEKAAQFLWEAMHPDLEELRRRDAFFRRIEKEHPVWIDDAGIVIEIPDTDVQPMMEE